MKRVTSLVVVPFFRFLQRRVPSISDLSRGATATRVWLAWVELGARWPRPPATQVRLELGEAAAGVMPGCQTPRVLSQMLPIGGIGGGGGSSGLGGAGGRGDAGVLDVPGAQPDVPIGGTGGGGTTSSGGGGTTSSGGAPSTGGISGVGGTNVGLAVVMPECRTSPAFARMPLWAALVAVARRAAVAPRALGSQRRRRDQCGLGR